MTPFEQIRLELEKASIEEKSIIKKYLQENEPIPADIDEKTKTFICCARRFKDPVQKDQLLAAVSKPQAYTFNKNNLSQDFFISILKNTSDLSKNNIAAAIRKEDPSSLTMQDKKIYAMIIFYLSLENNKHEREGVAELLKLTTDQLDTTIEKTIKEDQLIVPVEYFQPE